MSVALYQDDPQIPWRGVDPALARMRILVLLVCGVPGALLAVALAVTISSWLWLLVAVIALALSMGVWLIRRQVGAISFVELPAEIVIRRGRLFRSLVSIPYGRLQYADLGSGPLARRFGLASVTIHTANPASGGAIPGLPLAQAEALRERLTARGEAQRAGL